MFLDDARFPQQPTFADGRSADERITDYLGSPAADPAEKRRQVNALYASNRDAQRYIWNFNAERQARAEIYDRRIQAIHEATGVKLDNPARQPLENPGVAGWLVPIQLYDMTDYGTRQQAFDQRLDELAKQFPDKAGIIRPKTTVDAEIAQQLQGIEQSQGAPTPALGPGDRLVAGFAGAFAGSLRDPVQNVGLLFGAGGKGTTALARIGRTMLTEAAINSGIEGALQVKAQQWRAQNGLESGVGLALSQVGLAALFGGAFGGLLQGTQELMRLAGVTDAATRRAAERTVAGTASGEDFRTVADALGVAVPDEAAATARLSKDNLEMDAAAFADRPADLTDSQAATLADQAMRHAENPDAAPEPQPPVIAPERPGDLNRVIDDAQLIQHPIADGETFTVQGRPVTATRFDPGELSTDAANYQYKGNADAAGVTGRLGDVTQWDPTASGKVFVHERADGMFIADGHQRYELARRLRDAGDRNVRLDGYLYREADGWSVDDVRALAAKKNLQEGSGSVMDAARILRDRPDILDRQLPVSGPMLRKATALAQLSDDAWRLVTNGIAEDFHGAAVGRLVNDPTAHAAVLEQLAKLAPGTERATDLAVREIMSAGFRKETQNDMFGMAALQRSLMAERVKVLDTALVGLRRDKKLFTQLMQNSDVIEAAGNVLDSQGNLNRAATAENVAGLIDRLARSRGPISDALTRQAERHAEGLPAAEAARAFSDDVRQLIDEKGIKGVLEAPPPEVLKPAAHAEPATPEAAQVAEIARAQAPEVTARAADIWDMLPDGVDADGKPRFTTTADELKKADALDTAADLISACKD